VIFKGYLIKIINKTIFFYLNYFFFLKFLLKKTPFQLVVLYEKGETNTRILLIRNQILILHNKSYNLKLTTIMYYLEIFFSQSILI